jgi:hypothetical protein
MGSDSRFEPSVQSKLLSEVPFVRPNSLSIGASSLLAYYPGRASHQIGRFSNKLSAPSSIYETNIQIKTRIASLSAVSNATDSLVFNYIKSYEMLR